MTESTHFDLVWGKRSVWLKALLPAEKSSKLKRIRLIMIKKVMDCENTESLGFFCLDFRKRERNCIFEA